MGFMRFNFLRSFRARIACVAALASINLANPDFADAQKLIPGTGTKIEAASDDFEDPKWTYVPQNPKSSEEDDKYERLPAGYTTNRKWYEGIKRGHPDIVKRVDTPEGGPEGSKGAMLLLTLKSGIPNRVTYRPMQDDFVANVVSNVNGLIHVSRKPSVVTRVYMPPFEKWEQRTGNTFGYRIACRGIPTRRTNSEYGNGDGTETYWPGFFIWYNAPNAQQKTEASANFLIRGGPVGQDVRGPKIEKTGWWTMGISCSPDGMIHYYAKPGLEDLTDKDWLASYFPYGYRCTMFETHFFNVINMDDGKSWSTPWIVDNASVYYTPAATQQQPQRQQNTVQQRSTRTASPRR
jgi:hypothetical protein